MMRQFELIERVKSYNPQADEGLLNRAYVYAMSKHGDQRRASGDLFFSHPLEVAAILTELKLDDATIAAAVLHDTIEDTGTTRQDIEERFGPEIGALVDGLTKIKKLDFISRKATQGENFRKLLLAVAEDLRVLLVKLADRLHNMRTLEFVPPSKRQRIAEETLEIYAPLAGRMGIQEMRDELEDLAFRHLMQEAQAMISKRLAEITERSRNAVAAIEEELTRKLKAKGVRAVVQARQKQPYSVWRKMERKSLALEQLSDILGFRVIVDTPNHCYKALGVVHTTWPSVPGRFKDYISTPKQNDYRSLHTTVIGPAHQRVEMQIRTHEMHRIAEYGIAAHALYKDANGVGGGANRQDSGAYQWLKRTVSLLAEGDNPEEFLEHTKLELFHDQVFAFTPQGRLIALPRGATPIDFAYAVHTDIGNSAVGCKINGRIAPLFSELANGDEVEIIRAAQQVPPAAWEGLVVTGKARSAIRRATRDAVRHQYAGLGRQIIERAFERVGKTYSEDSLKAVLPRLARSTLDEVLAAVGRGEIVSSDIVRAVFPEIDPDQRPAKPAPVQEAGWFNFKKIRNLKFRVPRNENQPQNDSMAIPIRGLEGDQPVKFAAGGGALPGERIVGIMTPGEGITIYPIHSPALAQFENEPERWLDVRWDIDGERRRRFPTRISVLAINEPGVLAQIATVIAEHDGNIDNINMTRRSADFTELTIDLEVFDLKHFTAILTQLRARPVVNRAERVTT